LHIDFDIDQEPPTKDGCPMTETSTSKCRRSSKTGKSETL
jgi:hypothetical protein